MFLDTQARDWQISSVGDLSLVVGVGAGVQHFAFRSREIGRSMNFAMIRGAGGLEAGIEGRLGRIFSQIRRLLPLLQSSDEDFNDLRCLRPFCFRDIMWATAEVRSASVTVAGGATREIMSMRASGLGPNSGQWLFRNHDNWGSTLGIAAGASVTLGAMVPLGWAAYSSWADAIYRHFLEYEYTPPPNPTPGRPGRRF